MIKKGIAMMQALYDHSKNQYSNSHIFSKLENSLMDQYKCNLRKKVFRRLNFSCSSLYKANDCIHTCVSHILVRKKHPRFARSRESSPFFFLLTYENTLRELINTKRHVYTCPRASTFIS